VITSLALYFLVITVHPTKIQPFSPLPNTKTAGLSKPNITADGTLCYQQAAKLYDFLNIVLVAVQRIKGVSGKDCLFIAASPLD